MKIILTCSLLALNLLFAQIVEGQVLGCTSPQACNFDPAANLDDESCVFPQWYIPADIAGINPALQACSPPLGYVLADQGCVATIVANDPYCVNTDWDNICENAYNICVFGCAEVVDCLDPNACNYDPSGICDRGLCTYPGCTDPSAYNYNPAAGCDNETCNFFNECGNPIFYGNGQGIDFAGYMDPANWIVDTNGGNGSVAFSATTLNITGNNAGGNALFSEATVISPVAGNISFNWSWITNDLPQFDPAFVQIDGVLTQLTNNAGAISQSGQLTLAVSAGSTIKFYVNATDGCCGAATLTISSFQWPGNCIYGCQDIAACNYNPLANANQGCTYPGCTNPVACNYNPNAGCEDGTCVFGACTNPAACNYDPAATCDDGSCIIPPVNDTCENAIPLSNGFGTYSNNNTCDDLEASCVLYEGLITLIMTNDIWFSFEATGGQVILNCGALGQSTAAFPILYDSCGGEQIQCADLTSSESCLCLTGSVLNIPCGTLIPGQTYYVQVGGDVYFDNGYVNARRTGNIPIFFSQENTPILGCLDQSACNYDPNAECELLNSCTYPGCTDPNACNFDPEAGCDDGTCETLDCFGDCGGLGITDGCGNCVYGDIIEKLFPYQGAAYEFVVPENVFYISAELYGASGAAVNFFPLTVEGGKGGYAGGILQVTPGQTLYVHTGGKGSGAFGGYNGGGNGLFINNGQGSGGGGATDIRTSEFDLNTRLLVAGGGGGGSVLLDFGVNQSTVKLGGNAGGLNGQGVSNGIDFVPGATQFAAGPGGSLGEGADVTGNVASAGGGGGYYGGGADQANRSGGSGGSGFVHPSVINGITTSYDNIGNGYAIFRMYEIAECIPGCNDENASNFNPLVTFNDGTCEYVGCNDPNAQNFNPFAFINDGSCIYPGCTYPDAENFNPGANSDDGSCTFSLGGNDCAEDITGDGSVNTADLLALLAAFGTTCP